jgi:hypothetical protein
MRNKTWLFFSLILVLSGVSLAQTKTVTNADLEKFKQKRLQAEAEYRAKHKELGMPSPEELEQRNAENKRQLLELSNQIRYENQLKQDNWQSQASFLRNQLTDVNAQINYLNRLIAATPTGNKIFFTPEELNGAVIFSYGYGGRGGHGGRGGYGRGGYNQPQTIIRPNSGVQTAINAAASAPNPFYGTQLYPSGTKLVLGSPVRNRGRGGYGKYYGGYYGGFYPYPVNNGNFQREELISRLQSLGQVRAGLLAQWRNLVEEARRAGVRLD